MSAARSAALEKLRAAVLLDPYRETARLALEPWLVKAALDYLDNFNDPCRAARRLGSHMHPVESEVAGLVAVQGLMAA